MDYSNDPQSLVIGFSHHRLDGELLLTAYIDESERDEDFYFLGAIIVTPQQSEALVTGFGALLQKFNPTFAELVPDIELHGSAIMRGAEAPWRDLPFRLRQAVFRDALQVIVRSGARCYIEGIDRKKHQAKGYATTLDSRELAFGYLLERVNEVCLRLEKSAQLVADNHHTAAQSHTQFAKYQVSGTIGYRSSNLAKLVGPIRFADSRQEACLQAADLITYLFNRCQTVTEQHAKTAAAKHELWRIIEPACVWPRGRTRIWPS